MSREKRLYEMIMLVNRMKKFIVGELAHEWVVSKRTTFN
jgi:predicted DNA-binding transcriptional regulator YafY